MLQLALSLLAASNPFFVDNGPAGSFATAIATAPKGRVVVGGMGSTTDVTHGFGFVQMDFTGASAGPNHAWDADQFGASQDLVVGDDGTAYLVGYSQNESGSSSCLIEAVDQSGTQLWSYAFGVGDGYCGLTGVALDSSGRLVVVGWSGDFGPGLFDGIVGRLFVDGSWDTSFATVGFRRVGTTCPAGAGDDTLSDLVVRPDGTIVVVGSRDDWTNTCSPSRYDVLVAAFKADGTVLTSFGSGGQAIVNSGIGEAGVAIARRSSGQLVVVGNRTAPGLNDIMIAQLKANGSPDPTFGTGGIRTFAKRNAVSGLTLMGDGRIVITGYFRPIETTTARADLLVARFTRTGGDDLSFGSGTGFVQMHVGDVDSQFIGGDIVNNPVLGGFVVAGIFKEHTDTGAFPKNVIVGLRDDGSVDPSFGR